MSHQHTRKTFIAKVLGALAFTGLVAPRIIANPAAGPAANASPSSDKVPFAVRTDSRSVARSGDTV